MYYEEKERDPFEAFGEAEAAFKPDHDDSFAEDEDFAAEKAETGEDEASPQLKTGFSWAGFVGGLASLAWIGAAIGGPLSYFGIDAAMALDPAMQAGLIALAIGPALLFWVSASAAGEALKARRLAAQLTRMAHAARSPFEAGEAHAQRLGERVKGEIEALNEAVAGALDRLAELQSAARDNAALFGDAVAAARENTETVGGALAREREALAEINSELRSQTEAVAHSIGRQVRLMREASKLVKTEIIDAEEVLENHLAAFTATATVMGERTDAFGQVADKATAAGASLNGTMSAMLDGLSEATRLTDAARKSSEQALIAANDTAGALRETTRTAVHEAKRAAQFIRAETAAMQEAANDTLAKLRDAAQAAREASEESQAAADRHTNSIKQRLAALASTAGAARKQPAAARPAEPAMAHPAAGAASLRATADAAIAQARARVQAEARGAPRKSSNGFGGWGNFTPRMREEAPPKPANEDLDLVVFNREPANRDLTLRNDAIDLVTEAGVDLGEVLRPSDLDRIAQSSRDGACARRRAVLDSAPSAVGRIARHVRRHPRAQSVANEFRARPDLAKSEHKHEASELVRAYLLIDAALA